MTKILTITAILIVMFVHVPEVFSVESEVQQETLTIITDVVGLDMTTYTAALSNYVLDYPDTFGGLFREEVKYSLESEGNKAEVICTFVNNTFVGFELYALQGSPIFAKQSTDVLSATKGVLQRYQTYSKTNSLQEFSNILDTIEDAKPVTVTHGNLSLQISEIDNFVDIVWMHTINDVDFPSGLSVHFESGALRGFSDFSSFYKIGSSDVKISREEAINIAKEEANNLTTFNVSAGDEHLEVTIKLIDDPLLTEFQVVNREAFTYYPFWYVRFFAEEAQYGINGVQVGIWADTVEIAYCQPAGYMGDITDSTTPVAENNLSPETCLLIGTVATVIAIGIATFVFKKRKK